MHQAYMLLTNLILSFICTTISALSNKKIKTTFLYIIIFVVDFSILSFVSVTKPFTFLLIFFMFIASFIMDGIRLLRSLWFSLIFILLYVLSFEIVSLTVGVGVRDIIKYADVYVYNSYSIMTSLFICVIWIYITKKHFFRIKSLILNTFLSIALGLCLVGLIYAFRQKEILIYNYSVCLIQNMMTLMFVMIDIYRNKAFKNELKSNESRAQTKQYKLMLDNIESTKRIAHDMKNLMLRITSLIEEKSYGELKDYIYDLNSEIDETHAIETGNKALSAVLTYKRNELKHNGIDTKLMIGDNVSMLSDEEIFVLFGNLFDNANAAANDSVNKYVNLSVFEAGGYKNIRIINSVKEGFDTDFKTTDKADKQNHGIGMKSITSIVNNHKGIIDCYIEKNEAHINISFPND